MQCFNGCPRLMFTHNTFWWLCQSVRFSLAMHGETTTTVMPQSHCAESTPEWVWTDNLSLFEWSFLVILGHSSNDNDNDNQFEQCSSCPCSFGRSERKFWTCSKSLCTQQCPSRILFIRGYAHWKRVVIFFLAQLTCCILVILTVFVIVLTVYWVIRTDSENGADQKTVRAKTNGAAK